MIKLSHRAAMNSRKGKAQIGVLEKPRIMYNYTVDIDLAKFFDEVNHDRLKKRLSQRIEDKVLLKLIGKFLRSGLMDEVLVFSPPLQNIGYKVYEGLILKMSVLNLNLVMFIRKKKNKSGSHSVQIISKVRGKYKVVTTI